ncbi:MAG: hypothetical protein IPP72_00010 [Chitinophagaceae bacterium]|nr:hypothetical protein [Chitinophagaceae bacterium]
MKIIFLSVFSFFLAISFNKPNTQDKAANQNQTSNEGETGEVEIYLLKTVQFTSGKCQVDAGASAIEALPFITNDDIISYTKNQYEYELSQTAVEKIKSTNINRDGTPMALAVNGQIIYYFIFKPDYSNSPCYHSITMGYSYIQDNKVQMRLGYPVQVQGVAIEDKRNDQVLLTAFEQQNKLR